jgi:hypothetical protein
MYRNHDTALIAFLLALDNSVLAECTTTSTVKTLARCENIAHGDWWPDTQKRTRREFTTAAKTMFSSLNKSDKRLYSQTLTELHKRNPRAVTNTGSGLVDTDVEVVEVTLACCLAVLFVRMFGVRTYPDVRNFQYRDFLLRQA